MTNAEQVMPVKPAQALVNPLFPALDNALRSGRHISLDRLGSHAFLMDFQEYFEEFYSRYDVELIRTPEGFLYLRPCSAALTPRSILSELDVMVDKILRYLYLSPERPANGGIFTRQELYDELLTLADRAKLLKLVSSRSTGSGVDRQKLQEKARSPLNRLRRLGMVWFLDHGSSKFRITESIFRFSADMRSGDDPRETQRRLVRNGEAMAVENRLQFNDEPRENQPDSGEGEQ